MKMDHDVYEDLMSDLKAQEGFRSKPYKCSEGYLTIGYGRNLDTKGINLDEATWLLSNDVNAVYNDMVNRGDLKFVTDLPTHAQKALFNMCFQLGVSGLCKFKKMLTACQEQNWDKAIVEAEDSLWAKQTPKRFDYVKANFEACK